MLLGICTHLYEQKKKKKMEDTQQNVNVTLEGYSFKFEKI